MIIETDNFFELAKKHYSNPRKDIDIDFINTLIDNPGNRRKFIVDIRDNEISGVISYSEKGLNCYFLSFISTNKKFLNKKIATSLLNYFIQKTKSEKKLLVNSDYTEDGCNYIKHKINKIANEYKILFLEDKEKQQYFISERLIYNDLDNKNYNIYLRKYLKEIKLIYKDYDYKTKTLSDNNDDLFLYFKKLNQKKINLEDKYLKKISNKNKNKITQ